MPGKLAVAFLCWRLTRSPPRGWLALLSKVPLRALLPLSAEECNLLTKPDVPDCQGVLVSTCLPPNRSCQFAYLPVTQSVGLPNVGVDVPSRLKGQPCSCSGRDEACRSC